MKSGSSCASLHPEPWRTSFDNIHLFALDMERGPTPTQDLRELRRRIIWVGRTDNRDIHLVPAPSTAPLQSKFTS